MALHLVTMPTLAVHLWTAPIIRKMCDSEAFDTALMEKPAAEF
jgi:hypothetical protein